MKVVLLASTFLETDDDGGEYGVDQVGYELHPYNWWDTDSYISQVDELAEVAGRTCYQSWGRPNEKTATNAGYLANILAQKHYSVLEHASATFYIEGVSRSFTHELVRHRHLSFSQLSQRYVDESEAVFVVPPQLREYLDERLESGVSAGATVREVLEWLMDYARATYEELVDFLVAKGVNRKQARGAARSVLPNGTETKIVVTGNMRAWREFLEKRTTLAADEEIRAVAERIKMHLKKLAPNTFQDM